VILPSSEGSGDYALATKEYAGAAEREKEVSEFWHEIALLAMTANRRNANEIRTNTI